MGSITKYMELAPTPSQSVPHYISSPESELALEERAGQPGLLALSVSLLALSVSLLCSPRRVSYCCC